jgi:hypothetical protein
MEPNNKPNAWEIRYWPDANLAGPPRSEAFPTREEARARREEVMASGHPTHLRLFPATQSHHGVT